MKIVLVAIGKKHDTELRSAIDDFTVRIGRYVPVEWKLISSSDIETEGKAVLGGVGAGDTLVLFDERGMLPTSPDFASFLQKRFNEGPKRIVFVIAGAYGASDELRARAAHTISLSKLTFPHQLVRLIVVEQIYRGLSILRGEKYHHE